MNDIFWFRFWNDLKIFLIGGIAISLALGGGALAVFSVFEGNWGLVAAGWGLMFLTAPLMMIGDKWIA